MADINRFGIGAAASAANSDANSTTAAVAKATPRDYPVWGQAAHNILDFLNKPLNEFHAVELPPAFKSEVEVEFVKGYSTMDHHRDVDPEVIIEGHVSATGWTPKNDGDFTAEQISLISKTCEKKLDVLYFGGRLAARRPSPDERDVNVTQGFFNYARNTFLYLKPGMIPALTAELEQLEDHYVELTALHIKPADGEYFEIYSGFCDFMKYVLPKVRARTTVENIRIKETSHTMSKYDLTNIMQKIGYCVKSLTIIDCKNILDALRDLQDDVFKQLENLTISGEISDELRAELGRVAPNLQDNQPMPLAMTKSARKR